MLSADPLAHSGSAVAPGRPQRAPAGGCDWCATTTCLVMNPSIDAPADALQITPASSFPWSLLSSSSSRETSARVPESPLRSREKLCRQAPHVSYPILAGIILFSIRHGFLESICHHRPHPSSPYILSNPSSSQELLPTGSCRSQSLAVPLVSEADSSCYSCCPPCTTWIIITACPTSCMVISFSCPPLVSLAFLLQLRYFLT